MEAVKIRNIALIAHVDIVGDLLAVFPFLENLQEIIDILFQILQFDPEDADKPI